MTMAQGGTTITLRGSLYPYQLRLTRFQSAGVDMSGTAVKVRDDYQFEETYFKVVLHEQYSNIDDVRTFIINNLVFSKNTLTFTPDDNLDCGAGAGTAVTCRLWSSNFIDVSYAWQVFKPEMIFRVEITA